jgi:putative sterol carrier protein
MQEIMGKTCVLNQLPVCHRHDLQIKLSDFPSFWNGKIITSMEEFPGAYETTGRNCRDSTLKSEETKNMAAIFPSEDWLRGLEEKLNSDARYHDIAKNWEGDLVIHIEPEGKLKEQLTFYLDLWHGACRKVEFKPSADAHPNPTFTLTASYRDITSILTGKLSPMTAMMTSKLKVKGSMGYLMRNVPTILDFVRVAQEATSEIL